MMRPILVLAFALLVVALSADEMEGNEKVRGLLDKMKEATGEEYLKVRDELMKMEVDDSFLEGLAREEEWTEETWRDAFCAAVVLLWKKNRELCQRCYDLRGLKPDFFLKKRRPEPEVVRELVALGRDAAPIMLEIMLKTFQFYKFTEKAVGGYDAKKLRDMEEKALKVGIVAALGMLKDERAHHFLVELLRSGEDADVRAVAAKSIGRIGGEGAVSVLSERLSDSDESEEVRCGAALGLGFTGKREALDALLKQLEKEESENVCKEIAKALGFITSRWQRAEDEDEMERMRELAVDALLTLLDEKRNKATVKEALYTLVRVGDERTVKKMETLLERTEKEELRREILIGIDALKSRLRREKD